MKTFRFIFFALLLAGCTSTPPPQKKTMTAQAATPVAPNLANEIVAAYSIKLTAEQATQFARDPANKNGTAFKLTAQQVAQLVQLARDWANAKAEADFQCRPFHDGTTVQLTDGGWSWHDRVGVGHEDMEATVRFRQDGSEPKVEVLLLDNQELSMFRW